MRIGTDVSIETCRAEGYSMLVFDGRRKFDTAEYYRFQQTYPEYCREDNAKAGGSELPEYVTDTGISAKDVWCIYQDNKAAIDSFGGIEYDAMPSDHYELLFLADIVSAYCGIG